MGFTVAGGISPAYPNYSFTAGFEASATESISAAVRKATENSKMAQCNFQIPDIPKKSSVFWQWKVYRKSSLPTLDVSTTLTTCSSFVKFGNCRNIKPNCIPGYC